MKNTLTFVAMLTVLITVSNAFAQTPDDEIKTTLATLRIEIEELKKQAQTRERAEKHAKNAIDSLKSVPKDLNSQTVSALKREEENLEKAIQAIGEALKLHENPAYQQASEYIEAKLEEVKEAIRGKEGIIGYTLDLNPVPILGVPKEWEAPNYAVVQNINGTKCMTNNSDRTSVTYTIRPGNFNQPGDFVLAFTWHGNPSSGGTNTQGVLKFANGNTIPFSLDSIRVQFGDAPAQRFNKNIWNQTFTITRSDDRLSMTCPGLQGEVIGIREIDKEYGALTDFSITIPRVRGNGVGISSFSVRSLEEAGAGDGRQRINPAPPRILPSSRYTVNGHKLAFLPPLRARGPQRNPLSVVSASSVVKKVFSNRFKYS